MIVIQQGCTVVILTVVATVAVITLLIATSVTAFMTPHTSRQHLVAIPYTGVTVSHTSLIAATLDQPPTRNMNATDTDFYDDLRAQLPSVEKKKHQESDRTTLDVRIHGEWFDLTGTYFRIENKTSYTGKT